MSIVNPVSLYGLVVGFASDAQATLSVECSILYVVPFVSSTQVICIEVSLLATAAVPFGSVGNDHTKPVLLTRLVPIPLVAYTLYEN